MKKKRIALVGAIVAFASSVSIVAFAADESSHANSIEITSGDVTYSIICEKGNSLMRKANSDVVLTFDISVEGDTPFFVASYPTVAADQQFNAMLDTYENSVDCGTVTVKASIDQAQDTIYVRTPCVATKAEATIEVTDVDNFQVDTIYDEQLETYVTIIRFDIADIEATPNRATLFYDGHSVKSMFTNLYYDEVGNCQGGDLWFLNPENRTIPENFTILISEIHQLIPSETVAINLG